VLSSTSEPAIASVEVSGGVKDREEIWRAGREEIAGWGGGAGDAGGHAGSMRDDGRAEPTLYKRLGGREGIRGVVDDFVAFLVADPRVKDRFTKLTRCRSRS